MSAHAVTLPGLPSASHAGSRLLPRALALAYGVGAYAGFVGTFLYAVGFVGNWVVPKSIDSGASGPIISSLAVNTTLLLVFVVQHTVMARPTFKRWWTRIVPAPIERSTYVVLASASLAAVFGLWRPLPAVIWNLDQPLLAGALDAASLLGFATALASSFMVSHTDLFGLRQVWHRFRDRIAPPIGFRLVGLYKLVRHPLMVGFLIAFWATPHMTVGHLFFAGMTTLYIFFGAAVEERDLMREHPESYRHYRRTTRGFVPIPRHAA